MLKINKWYLEKIIKEQVEVLIVKMVDDDVYEVYGCGKKEDSIKIKENIEKEYDDYEMEIMELF